MATNRRARIYSILESMPLVHGSCRTPPLGCVLISAARCFALWDTKLVTREPLPHV